MTKDMTSEDIDDLIEGLGDATLVASTFAKELERMQNAMVASQQSVSRFEKTLSRGLSSALEDIVVDGTRMSDALRSAANSMVRSTFRAATKPVTDHLAGAISDGVSGLFAGVIPFSNGAGFAQGRVMPFAKGGVVSSPTVFPMRGATGLMGEAGPEAIMPLTRGADGSLGVRAHSGSAAAPTIIMNIQTPDVQGFQRSQGQVAAHMTRALARGQRNS